MNLRDLFSELRRRRVLRVVGVYALVGWLTIQVAATTFPVLMLPEWTTRLVVALFLLGMPVVVALAWMFDITPAGIERTPSPADTDAPPAAVAPTARPGRLPALAVALLLLAALGMTVYRYSPLEPVRTEGAAGLDRSIAVLPFTNMSGDADNEYFSDGITEDVLAHLSQIADLKVISRTSVMGYKGTTLRLGDIGEELGVAHVLEGSVRREGSRVRIVAQLIDARTDQRLWTQTYDRELTGIFEIQSEIARQIARALQARLSPAEQTRIASAATADLTAYDLFLRAREFLHNSRAEDRESARALLRQALEIDPDFAQAWAELSRTWFIAGVQLQHEDSAMVAARKSVELAPQQAEGYVAVAHVLRWTGRGREAIEWYERAWQFNPNDVNTIGGLAFARFTQGQWDEALRLFRQAAALDPTAALRHRQVAFTWHALGEVGRAENAYTQAVRLAPDNPTLQRDLFRLHLRHGDVAKAAIHLEILHRLASGTAESEHDAGAWELERGDTAAAMRHFERAAALAPDEPPPLALARLHLERGDRERARTILYAHEERARAALAAGDEGPGPYHDLARVFVLRGEHDAAIEQLELAVRHHIRYGFLAHDALLDGLRGERRFEQLLARLDAERERQRQRALREGW